MGEDEIYRRLMHGDMKLRRWEIDRMDLCEITLALDEELGGMTKAPGGGVPLNDPGSMAAYAAMVRQRSPREWLERERMQFAR